MTRTLGLLCGLVAFAGSFSAMAQGPNPLPTIGRHMLSQTGEVVLDATARQALGREMEARFSRLLARPYQAGQVGWEQRLGTELVAAQNQYLRDRVGHQILDLNVRAYTTIVGGALGTAGGPPGIAAGVALGDQAADLIMRHALGDPLRKARERYEEHVATLVIDVVSRQQDPVAVARSIRDGNPSDELIRQIAADTDSALGQDVLATITPQAREDLVRRLAVEERVKNHRILRAVIENAGEQTTAAIRQEVQASRSEMRRIGSEITRIARRTEEHVARVRETVELTQQHVVAMRDQVDKIHTQVSVTGGDVRLLLDAQFATMSPAHQITALRRGIPTTMGDEDRAAAITRLRTIIRLRSVDQNLEITAGIINGAVGLADTLGVQIDPGTRRSIAVLQENISTGRRVLSVFSGFVSGGWVGAAQAAFSAFGSDGGASPMPPELSASLGRMEEQIRQINVKLEEILQLQRQTLDRLDALSVQLAEVERNLTIRLQRIENLVGVLIAISQDPAQINWTSCESAVIDPATGAPRTFRSLTERRRFLEDQTREAYLRGCLNFARPGVTAAGSGLQIVVAGNNVASRHHMTSRILLGAGSPASDDWMAVSARRTLADHTLLMTRSDGVVSTCDQIYLSSLVASPAVLPAFQAMRPQAVCVPGNGPGRAWENSVRIAIEPWRLLDAPMHLNVLERYVDYLISMGDWRAVLRRENGGVSDTEARYRVLTIDEALGRGVALNPGLWNADDFAIGMIQAGDLVDVAIAIETIATGAPLAERITQSLFGNPPAADTAPPITMLPDLGAARAPQDAMRAWSFLQRLQDRLDARSTEASAKAIGSLGRAGVVLLALNLFGDDTDQSFSFGPRALRSSGDRGTFRNHTATLKVEGEENWPPANPTDAERAFLRSIAWMLAQNSDSDGRHIDDVACRPMAVERAVNNGNLAPRPTDDPSATYRGWTSSQRERWLNALSRHPADLSYQLAACLFSLGYEIQTNTMLTTVLGRLSIPPAGAERDRFLRQWTFALSENDGRMLQRMLPDLPLSRAANGQYAVRMRLADGRLHHAPLPEGDALRAQRVARTPSLEALLSLRERIGLHLMTHQPVQDHLLRGAEGNPAQILADRNELAAVTASMLLMRGN